MTWSITNSGKHFHYDNVNPDSICLPDIAHALSYQCRYNGHCHMFYSTAEHSLNLAQSVFKKYQKATGAELDRAQMLAKQCLLHDAAEAYISDVPHPMKALLPEYVKMEEHITSVILTKYGLPPVIDDEVKDLDRRIFVNEKRVLFPSSFEWAVEDELPPIDGVDINGFIPVDIYPMYSMVLKSLFGDLE